ncbi:MAG TPA: hypothetical protein VIH86_00165 [Puia sp.]
MPTQLFQKGSAGRIPGTKNKTTGEIKEVIRMIVEDRLPKIYERLDELSLKEQSQLIVALLVYVLPKKASVETTKQIELPKEFDLLTVEQITAIENIMKGEPLAYQVETKKQITSGSKPF